MKLYVCEIYPYFISLHVVVDNVGGSVLGTVPFFFNNILMEEGGNANVLGTKTKLRTLPTNKYFTITIPLQLRTHQSSIGVHSPLPFYCIYPTVLTSS